MIVPLLSAFLLAPLLVSAACTSNSSNTAALQKLIQDGGAGYTLQLCPSNVFALSDVLNYTAINQEISTEGYPTDDTRATLVVSGFNKTTAVSASTKGRDGAVLRNIIINGNRKANETIYKGGGGNIEFGGVNSNQTIEYVKTYDPRGWSCMHISEGQLNCYNATIQNNDIGPCGTDYYQNWADGVSLSCSESLVQNNEIVDATDGGIVVFGAPFSTIRNNTIRAKTRIMIGGINMVDVKPWKPIGNYSHTVVEGNTIYGGFATGMGNDTLGPQDYGAIIKMGIALGPDAWFSDQRFGANKSTGGVIRDNSLSGAFAFGMGVTSAEDFVIENNTFFGNTSFIGVQGPNCTTGWKTPHPSVPLLSESTYLVNVSIDVPDSSPFDFVNGTGIGLTCFVAPNKTEYAWPYGGGQVNSVEPSGTSDGSSGSQTSVASTASATSSDSAGSRGVATQGPWVLVMSWAAGLMLAVAGGISVVI
ncbi:hypothetical protein L202_02172 [Cryptococcus amylolentus CBS 6039]|uniref:Right handed beta helix domain-containing protein n=2 Tax=Cryptococcus amylolentus TaxID=104669 RepID=A0A1E3HZX9_9TREE|nr:hypothetical protein L202_02172 [Cryptococcus amylolentus CBS 6039]ODN81808.1 hypothetical protein L202_02172 [Cryptococcus amylolentus CBS 6039]ODO10020.1 hypothetical protein I350_02245 [Cryptococcus amylolentus CBS 6273]